MHQSADYVWGVIDAIPLTNFVRWLATSSLTRLAYIFSFPSPTFALDALFTPPMLAPYVVSLAVPCLALTQGLQVMIIPQERDLVRLYIQLPVKVKPGEYLDRSKVTAEAILDTARNIMAPYTLDTKAIDWFTGPLFLPRFSSTKSNTHLQATTSASVSPSRLRNSTAFSLPEMVSPYSSSSSFILTSCRPQRATRTLPRLVRG